jgi:hypothetical protein
MGWEVNATPRPLYSRGKTRYPLCRRLGERQGQSGWVQKISPPPEFDPRIVQPVKEPLYRLRYPGPVIIMMMMMIIIIIIITA